MAVQSQAFISNFSCPDFSLLSVDDRNYKLSDFDASKALLVVFMCNHCPYVKAIEARLIALGRRFAPQDLQIVGICSNDASKYPDDSKQALYERFISQNYGFPYLLDLDGQVAKKFDAVCTPDLFLFDQERKLFYHGRLDDNWREESKVSKHDLADALQDLLANKNPPPVQIPSMGCSIKWP